MKPDDAKQAWQASVEIAGAPPLEEVRAGADKFYRQIRTRNRIEYGACALVVVVFTTYFFMLPHVLQKLGAMLVVLATFYVAWQLHRRASAMPPERAGEVPLYVFLRAQMVRQRDALRGIFWWYVLPFLPGMVLSALGNVSAKAGETRTVELSGPSLLFVAGFVATVVTIVCWANWFAARRLQQRIDEIDALMGGSQ